MTLPTLIRRTNLSATNVVFGGIWLSQGGGPSGDGDRPDRGQANANAAVLSALKAGIREFDTAPWYGSGAAEERLGHAVQSAAKNFPIELLEQNPIRITTKTGRLFYYYDEIEKQRKPVLGGIDDNSKPPPAERICVNDYTSHGTRESLSHSLGRLGLTKVHGLRIHDPNDNSLNSMKNNPQSFVDEVAIALCPKTGMIGELCNLRDAGVISEVSLGMNCNDDHHMGAPTEILRVLRETPMGTFDSALLAGGWNLLNQDGIECYVECEKRGINVTVAGIFGSGLLASSDTATSKENFLYAYRTAPKAAIALKERWSDLARQYSVSVPAVAIAFATLPKCADRICIGLATPEQVEQTMQWVDESNSVPNGIWEEAKTWGLLHESVPQIETQQ